MSDCEKIKNEIRHGETLAPLNTEKVWGWGGVAGEMRSKRRADLIAAGACLEPGKKVLEIGCGTGYFTEMFAQTGAEIVAVDLSQDLIRKAKSRDLDDKQVRFLVKPFEDCDLDGPFDAIIGSSILHHLQIPDALKKIYKLLKPGGKISFAEPNLLNPQVFLERVFSFLPCFWYVSLDETAFIRWRLAKIFKELGYCNIKMTPFDWLHPKTPAKLIEKVLRVSNTIEKTPIIREFSGSIYIFASR
jgi:2-polyprenyl-3-methyl-5-hydroxy-6-metoxy-1,4-benzoquinol methylase